MLERRTVYLRERVAVYHATLSPLNWENMLMHTICFSSGFVWTMGLCDRKYSELTLNLNKQGPTFVLLVCTCLLILSCKCWSGSMTAATFWPCTGYIKWANVVYADTQQSMSCWHRKYCMWQMTKKESCGSQDSHGNAFAPMWISHLIILK